MCAKSCSLRALHGSLIALLATVLGARSADAQKLLFADGSSDRVQQVNWPSGGSPTTLIPSAPSGLDSPVTVKVGPDGMIYVTAWGTVNGVLRYHPNGTYDPSFTFPPSAGLQAPVGLAFHPKTGILYVSDVNLGKVVLCDPDTSTLVGEFSQGLQEPTGLDFNSTGDLFVCDWMANSVVKLESGHTTFDPCVSPGSGGLMHPADLLVVGSQIYVTSFGTSTVLRYSTSTGNCLGMEAPLGSEVLSNVFGIARDPKGDIYIACNDTGSIEKYSPNGAGYLGTFAVGTNPVGLCFLRDEEVPFPVRAREVVATYCPTITMGGSPDPNKPSVILVDARTGGPTGRNWLARHFSNEKGDPTTPNAWTYANLGPVFGVTVDDAPAPNIFVAATSAYGSFPYTAHGGGAVFKLTGCEGEVLPWIVTGTPAVDDNKLPNDHEVGLGDICYDRKNKQFFVSNLEDGKIYRFEDGGQRARLLDSFDPFGPHLEPPAVMGDPPGPPVLGDRIWALHVPYNSYVVPGSDGGELIFSVWLLDKKHPTATWPTWLQPFDSTPSAPNNALFSVGLDSSGAIQPSTLKLLEIMPYLSASLPYSNPVSDITSYGSRILFTAEKTMDGEGIPGVLLVSHYSRTLAFARTANGLIVGDLYRVGDVGQLPLPGTNYPPGAGSSGGVAVDDRRHVWSTGDAIQLPGWTLPANPDQVYGLQRFPLAGNLNPPPGTTWSWSTKMIDLDWELGEYDKNQSGDVEVIPFDADASGCPGTTGFSSTIGG